MKYTPPLNAIPLAAGHTIQGLAGSGSAITYTIIGTEVIPDGDARHEREHQPAGLDFDRRRHVRGRSAAPP